jgi:dienelactone hydrolase
MPTRSHLANGLCLALIACLIGAGGAAAQERVTFPSLDGRTTLVASLRRPQQEGPRPALVLLHGCPGLQTNGRIYPLYRAWSQLFVAAGYVALTVDSAGSRGFGATCTASPARRTMLADRPKDTYGALEYLQAQPFVRADRVGAVGWSQGGATVLLSIGTRSPARPQGLAHDFRAAVAFYPGACSERLQTRPFVDAEPQSWTTAIPLLVLQGDADNWTPPGPCEEFIAGAKARGAPVEFKLYPGALHVFDAPGLQRRELPEYRMQNGVVPLAGSDPAARADARVRVGEFLRRHLEAE